MEKNIHLTSEQFQGLLQGKKLVFDEYEGAENRNRTTIFPPHYGLYFTHEQIAEIERAAKHAGARELIDLMDSLKK